MKKFVYFLFALAVVILFAFQMQEEQKFYYAFDEKISLTNIDNKFVVRYSHAVDKENASSALRKAYDNSSLLWHDEKTVVLTLDSKANTKEVVDNLKQLSDIASLQPIYKINTGLEMIITDEFVVKFKANAKKADIQMINEKFGTTLTKQTDTYLLLKVARGGDALDVANQYQRSGLVEFSHPNFIIQVEKHQQVIPNDPYFVNQFTLNNTGQVFNDGHFGTIDADIDAPEAWAMTTGVNNILVAVLDEGISPNHPDLPNARQVRLNGSNFTDGNQNDPSPTNSMNHGNSCAGVIAATQNNNEGIAGICPNCRIMPIRIFNSNPTIGLTPTQLADAINFARNNGADIISNSWGFNSDNPNFQPVIVTAIQNATTQGRVINGTARGCVVVFSAGNNAIQNGFVHFPSNVNVPGVLTVGASDRTDLKSFYSPLGNPASSNNQVLDVTAPSHRAWPDQIAGETFEAWTIDIPGNTGYNPWPQFTTPGAPPSTVPPAIGEQLPNAGINFQSYTGRFGGTSHSCPVVAGIAALMLSANPNLTQQQVFNIITGAADQVGGYVYTNGRSNELGFGRVNACRAVLQAYNTGNSIAGQGLVCNTATYSLLNSPNVDRITWSSSNPTGLTINPTTGVATRLNNFSGQITITATINGGCGPANLTRTVWVGTPTITFVEKFCVGTEALYRFKAPIISGATYLWSVNNPNLSVDFFNHNCEVSGVPGGPSQSYVLTLQIQQGNCTVTKTRSGIYADCAGGGSLLYIFPNPASDELILEYSKDTYSDNANPVNETVQIELISSTLEKVWSLKTNDSSVVIPVRNLPKGIYYLNVTNRDGIIRRQILIEH